MRGAQKIITEFQATLHLRGKFTLRIPTEVQFEANLMQMLFCFVDHQLRTNSD